LIHFEQVRCHDEIDPHSRIRKKNTAEHTALLAITPELAELVSIRDRSVIERFGYVFEKAPPPAMPA
jgi:hypothetical protein